MGRFLMAGVVVILSSQALAEWQPPEKPEPSTILDEAQRDTRAGRYDDALAKHVWYHENALKHEPAQSGVRRSYALADWLELGKKHPPALAKLEAYRQEGRKRVLASKEKKEVFEPFADFAAISRYLEKDQEIVELFEDLDEKHPELAPRAYIVADDALIAAGKFELCGKYLNGDKLIAGRIYLLEHDRERGKNPRYARQLAHSEETFRREAATTVAILVKCNREEEAERVAEMARTAWDDAELREVLEKALKGELPERE
jgi:hypothetical protein